MIMLITIALLYRVGLYLHGILLYKSKGAKKMHAKNAIKACYVLAKREIAVYKTWAVQRGKSLNLFII